VLSGLTTEQLNSVPGIDGANSAYVIAAHVFGNARAWVLGVACGQDVTRDRPAEFASSGSYEELSTAARRVSAEVEGALKALSPSALDRRLVPPQKLWGAGEPYEISVRQALADVLEHASIHLGHVQMTRDIVLRESRP